MATEETLLFIKLLWLKEHSKKGSSFRTTSPKKGSSSKGSSKGTVNKEIPLEDEPIQNPALKDTSKKRNIPIESSVVDTVSKKDLALRNKLLKQPTRQLFESSAERKFKDPFKTSNYPEEWSLFKKTFDEPVERLLRYFIYVYNMYHVYTVEVQEEKNETLMKILKKKRDVKGYLENETNVFLLHPFIEYFYKHYAPERVDKKKIEALIDRYSLVKTDKYGSGDYTNYLVNGLYKRYIFEKEHPGERFIYQPLYFGVEFEPTEHLKAN